MFINICKHHGLPFLNGQFCAECHKDLDKVRSQIEKPMKTAWQRLQDKLEKEKATSPEIA